DTIVASFVDKSKKTDQSNPVTKIWTKAAGPDPVGTIYVADNPTGAIDVFAPGANGNVAPIRRITGLRGPGDVAVDSAGDLYATTGTTTGEGAIVEFGPG